MSVIEIVLVIIGAGVFLLGYFLPAGKKNTDEEVQLISEAEIRKMIENEAESVRDRVSDIVDETIGYSIEKTERAMERVANEKIMAVNEYSDTVLEEINKNHKEVTFLYDMLNDKHDTLMTSIGEANQITEEIRQTIRDAEITASETAKKAKGAEEAVEGAMKRIRNAELSAREAQEAVQDAVQSVMGAVEDTRTDLFSLHSARAYSPEVLEEVRGAGFEDGENEGYAEADAAWEREPETEQRWESRSEQRRESRWDSVEETEREPAAGGRRRGGSQDVEEFTGNPVEDFPGEEEDADFRPIRPKRVEIIHEPEADYVAEEADLSASAAFANMGIFGSREAMRESARETAPEEPREVDIRVAQGKDNGRNSNERILELHKAGKSNMAIAKELGLGLGEVKLVIDLFEGV